MTPTPALTYARNQWQACLALWRRERSPATADALRTAERAFFDLHQAQPAFVVEPRRPMRKHYDPYEAAR